ncbi:hypothetical protein BGZ94_008784 [Podila epigama]|nr:hypothetical protein BGZ94_008784 [Podila epigama]
MSNTSSTLQFRVVPEQDIPQAYAIEIAVFSEDESATLETIQMRQKAAPELMFGCYDGATMIGYIISTMAKGEHLSHSSMYRHDPEGNAVCIHSVCVVKDRQRQGIATKALRAYLTHLEHMRDQGRLAVDRVLLIAHKELLGLYAGVGFVEVGLSPVVHGPDPWYEMIYKMDD